MKVASILSRRVKTRFGAGVGIIGGTHASESIISMRYPTEVHSICSLDVIEPLVQEAFELSGDNKLNVAISYNLDDATIAQEDMLLGDELEEMVKELNVLPPQYDRYDIANINLDMSHTKLSPSIE
ncbi:hypothetical protein GH714_040653 [Hevea brasiliensis]|uniref:Uncharacterized protein n=1 Tax=Hevea brasiliensis TaxID=3981 RepID=A0A6A6MTX1_HEVBR|nr:hypothetical protein GH714_040653 [Hevea brasiliensis]